jgi:RNA polymerase sigma-70 factor (ECF subfamily)
MKDDLLTFMPDLRAFSRFLCREPQAADDLLQHTVEAAIASQGAPETASNPKARLFAIMRTQFFEAPAPSHNGAGVTDDIDANVSPAGNQASREALAAALWRLNPYYREALVLVGAGGFTYQEAAQLCGCAVGTMKARVSRARRQLADAMH